MLNCIGIAGGLVNISPLEEWLNISEKKDTNYGCSISTYPTWTKKPVVYL